MQTAVSSSVHIRAFRLALTVSGIRFHTINNYVRDVERLLAFCEGRRVGEILEGLSAYGTLRSSKVCHWTDLANKAPRLLRALFSLSDLILYLGHHDSFQPGLLYPSEKPPTLLFPRIYWTSKCGQYR